MASSDLLNNLPASASIPVYGHWALRFHETIQCRRYTIASEDAKAGSSSLDPDLRLEHAWRQINSTTLTDVADILDSGCAIVAPVKNEQSPEKSSDSTPCLWVFSSGRKELNIPGLQEEPEASIDPLDLISCDVHGSNYDCLKRPGVREGGTVESRDKCRNLRWTPKPAVARAWSLLTDALVESLAWRKGRRVIMQPIHQAYEGHTELQGLLYPLSRDKCALRIQAKEPPRISPKDLNVLDMPNQLVFVRPLYLPAITLGPFSPNDTQSTILSESFSAALGSTWNTDRTGKQLVTELDRTVYNAWSVVWVPRLKSNDKSVDSWTLSQGILTVWPTHLLLDACPTRPTSIPVSQPPGSIFASTTPDDLMASATEIYQLMSREASFPTAQFHPSDATTVVPPDQSAAVISPESPIFGSESEQGDKSDIDDLFSAHSGEDEPVVETKRPVKAEVDFELLSEIADEDEVQEEEKQVQLERDVIMDFAQEQDSEDEGEGEAEGEITQITEDDFAFFDSPRSPQDEVFPTAQTEEEPYRAPEEEAAEPVETVEPKPELDEHPVEAKETDGDTSIVRPVKQVQFAPSPPLLDHSHTHSSPEFDLIPTDFVPLHLGPVRASAFPYSLPSPATTPEALRVELVDRLRKPNSKYKDDYAAAWDVESDVSDMEPDDGSPPGPLTPESMMDDGSAAGNQSLISTESASEADQELRWRSKKCISADWLWLREQAVDVLAVPWEIGWAGGSKSDAAVEPEDHVVDSSILEELDCSRLANHILADRHLRMYIEGSDAFRVNVAVAEAHEDDTLAWMRQGSALCEFIDHHDNEMHNPSGNPKSLAPLSVHVGFAGSVMSLGAAGLRYWPQLGLEPVGGRKDIAFSVLHEKASGAEGATLRFLQALEGVYESLGLGKLTKQGSIWEQVAACDPSDLVITLNTRLCQDLDGAAIFCILFSTDLQTIIRAGFSSKIIDPTQDGHIYHIFPGRFPSQEDLVTIAFDIYDRIPRPVRPISIRGLPMSSSVASIQSPHFTLVNEDQRKPELTLAWPLKSYDVMNRWTMIHCAYDYDEDLDMAVAMVLDDQGQSWRLGTFLGLKDSGTRIAKLWDYINDVAEQMAVEYRLTIFAPPTLSVVELNCWKSAIVKSKIPTSIVHASGTASSRIKQTSLKPIGAIPPALFADASTRLIDESLTAYYASHYTRAPVHLPARPDSSSHHLLFPHSVFLLSIAMPNLSYESTTLSVLYHESPPGKSDEDISLLLAGAIYRLIALGRLRFGFDSSRPAHVEGVNKVLSCFRKIAAV
ncbi:hypothetical protein BD324DRAFT_610744 [Kockovaella imperatae]|uniref:Uncharacterized protein n=1 Tax=Kockovaella imperatae TaxID=4999 RepID=A0A1Y1UQW5_9TREE|nr:hypothetical protein BD324DRAFT_610744 [Kockovaella imperatae]ORX40443.1 hypothetical protein BD324DRAFT_610744 [Kockovaella imperatae]